MRLGISRVILAALLAGATAAADAAILSKTYQFKPDIDLQVGESLEGGLRLDSVHFFLPSSTGGMGYRSGGVPRAEVAVSNLGTDRQMYGVAIVLLDEQGRLVGAANGGPKIMGLRPQRQLTSRVVFDGVNGEAYKATQFKISIENKP